MRVVVTGATGFMGSRLCAVLADAGHDVRAFTLRGVDASGLPPSVEVFYGDVTDEDSLAAAFHGRDAVFHAAAAVEAWLPDASVFHTVNVGGLENVLKAAKRTPAVKKIVYTSSYFAIGPTDGYVADEKQIHQGKAFCTEYERSKFLADGIALQASAEGVPITIVYPGVMYGPGMLTSGNLVCRVLIERFNGRLPGYIGNGYDRESFPKTSWNPVPFRRLCLFIREAAGAIGSSLALWLGLLVPRACAIRGCRRCPRAARSGGESGGRVCRRRPPRLCRGRRGRTRPSRTTTACARPRRTGGRSGAGGTASATSGALGAPPAVRAGGRRRHGGRRNRAAMHKRMAAP